MAWADGLGHDWKIMCLSLELCIIKFVREDEGLGSVTYVEDSTLSHRQLRLRYTDHDIVALSFSVLSIYTGHLSRKAPLASSLFSNASNFASKVAVTHRIMPSNISGAMLVESGFMIIPPLSKD
jgi:hypothetical protein